VRKIVPLLFQARYPSLSGEFRIRKRTCKRGLTRSIAVLQACVIACVVISCLAGIAAAQSAPEQSPAWILAQKDPGALVRKTSQGEIAHSYGHRAPMRYRLRKITDKSDTTKMIVETTDGAVARLIATEGRPLSPAQTHNEINRLHSVELNPAVEAHRRKSEKRDASRVEEIMRSLPNAFLYQYAGAVGTPYGKAIRLTFIPNPKFSPPDLMSRVMTGIRGDIWIHPGDLRVIRMDGHIFKTVNYGWGLLGTLDPGGGMLLEQTKTNGCGWQLSRLSVRVHGKALLFKKLHISIEETVADYHPVPANWSYKDAVEWLLTHAPPTGL
jgi:hypothetical protein